jgi:hypothetical protein
MTPSAPWLAHYDAGVPATLSPYPDRTLLDYVTRHGFPLFAWWRIIVGVLGLLGLTLSSKLHDWAAVLKGIRMAAET